MISYCYLDTNEFFDHRLGWRWRIDRVIEQSDIATKQGDDFAARLYVFFDYPIERLSLVERTKLNLAR